MRVPSWRSSGLSARGGREAVSQSSGGSACRKVRSENAVRGRVSPLVSLHALTEGREMARTARVKLSGTGVADYHLMSRTNDRRFLFEKAATKTMLVDALRRAAEFCGVRILAHVAMSNHFHVVVRVTRTDAPVPEDELVRRVGVLKGEKAAKDLSERWAELHAAGFEAALAEEQDRLRAQMNDISAFVKVFKETFDRRFKRERAYTGSIWAGRFMSTLIGDGRYLATCLKYVVYNPIRAGIVTQAKDYPWSWCEKGVENEVFAGAVPEEWCLRRRAQIGAGRVFGSAEFVRRTAFGLGWCFRAKSVGAHGIVGLPPEAGASVLGWRIAAWDERVSSCACCA